MVIRLTNRIAAMTDLSPTPRRRRRPSHIAEAVLAAYIKEVGS